MHTKSVFKAAGWAPLCQEWNVSTHPASVILEEAWEQIFLWREPLRTKEDPGCNFFSSHSNMQTQESLSDVLFMEMWLMTEKVWQSHVQLSVFLFPPYVYDVKYINHYYLSNFPMTCIFKFQNFHTAPF